MINVPDSIARLLVAVGLRSNETLFDPDYYCSTYADVAAAGVDPYEHYISFGVAENRSPNISFDTQYYLSQTRDRPRDPTQHYLTKGAAAGLDPHPLFETRWYLNAYPDVAGAGVNPLKHFLSHGRHENRETAPRFRRTFGRIAGFSRDRTVNRYQTLTFTSPRGAGDPSDVHGHMTSGDLHDAYVVMTFATEPQRQALFTALSSLSGLEQRPYGSPTGRALEVTLELGGVGEAELPTLGLVFISPFVTNTLGKLSIDAAGVRLYFIDPTQVRLIRAFGPFQFIGKR